MIAALTLDEYERIRLAHVNTVRTSLLTKAEIVGFTIAYEQFYAAYLQLVNVAV
jgi:hypothetical protein